MISIIIPVLNESKQIHACLEALQTLRSKGYEIIIVDGGSDDNTLDIAQPLADQTINSETGRARQMNAGADIANGDVLLFLHADTRLPENFIELFTPPETD